MNSSAQTPIKTELVCDQKQLHQDNHYLKVDRLEAQGINMACAHWTNTKMNYRG